MTDDRNEIMEVQTSAIASAAPEVDVQIATAKKYPRSVKAFLDEAQTMATIDDATAASMAYALPRAGKTIEGPSIRLAEIMAGAWGNLRADTRIVETDGKHITAEAMCWDLEKNVAIRTQVKRRITDKYGKRYNDDMIVVTGNAASAIAFRNAVFKVIPGSYVTRILEAAQKVAIGDAANLSVLRDKWVKAFSRFGIPEERVLATIERASIEDVDIDDVGKLRGFFTSIRDEGADVQDVFPVIETEEDKTRKESLKKKLANGKKLAGDEAAPETKSEPSTSSTGPDDEETPFTLDGEEVDKATGEILNPDDEAADPITGDAIAEEKPDPNACKACGGSGQSSKGEECVACAGTGAGKKKPPAKPKAVKPKEAKKPGPQGTGTTDKALREERSKLVAKYIDVCESYNVEMGNVSNMTTPTIAQKIAEITGKSK